MKDTIQNKSEIIKFESWMKRGAKVTTQFGNGVITFVRKNGDEVYNFNVKIYSQDRIGGNNFYFKTILMNADKVKPL